MEKHYGQIVEHLVRKNGFSITDLAMELGVNRRSIYNFFQNRYLKNEIILKIGQIIRHDFSKEFPEFFTNEDFLNTPKQIVFPPNSKNNIEDDNWKNKYMSLLESYNKTLLMHHKIFSVVQ